MTKEDILRTLKSILAEINESENAVCYVTSEDREVIKSAIKALKPKTGHWIDTDEGFSPCKCSECELVEFKRSKFCPNCGCRMESEEV